MKEVCCRHFFTLLIIFTTLSVNGTDFKAGDKISVNDPVEGDLYIAGSEIEINATIKGDLVTSGGEIYLKDSVMQDLLIAGGQLYLNGFVGDDVRAGGGRIKLGTHINGDLIIFGGQIDIDQEAVIGGNLIIYGGDITVYGIIKGNIKVAGGSIKFQGVANGDASFNSENLEIDGTIYGKSTLVADDILLGNNARFHSDVSYWSEAGDMDFGNALVGARATFNQGLEKEYDMFNGTFYALGIIYVFSVLLILLLLNFLFGRNMAQAAKAVNLEPAKSLGYGFLYLLGLPLLALFLLAIVIGIPVALFLLFIYIFTWVFGLSLASVLMAHAVKDKYNYKNWGTWILLLVSIALFLILKFVTMIPFIGWLFYLLIIAITIGALSFNWIQEKFSKDRQSQS